MTVVTSEEDRQRRTAFVSALYRTQRDLTGNNAFLAAQARQRLARLRRTFVGDRQQAEAYDILFEHDPPDAEIDAWILVGGLFGLHPTRRPGSPGKTTIGYAMRQLATRDGSTRPSESVERRFTQLLSVDQRRDAVSHYLRQAVQLLRSKGVELDYYRLLDDLVTLWRAPLGDDARRVRLQWARDFHRAGRTRQDGTGRGEAGQDQAEQQDTETVPTTV